MPLSPLHVTMNEEKVTSARFSSYQCLGILNYPSSVQPKNYFIYLYQVLNFQKIFILKKKMFAFESVCKLHFYDTFTGPTASMSFTHKGSNLP